MSGRSPRTSPSGADVVIVGGGIAGAALATGLAGRGLSVVVLEATTSFTDRVRGESLQPWGVAEAIDLGVHDVLLAAGARSVSTWVKHTLDGEPSSEIPVGALLPDVAGSLNLAHPLACDALLRAAQAAGAVVHRGIADVRVVVVDGRATVTATSGHRRLELSTDLVVGADGRGSTVRRQAGIKLHKQRASHCVAGLLLSGIDADHDVIAECEDGLFVLFHQAGGRARAYLCVDSERAHRYGGPGGADRFLLDCAATAYPDRKRVTGATAAGPCAAVAGTDTWCDEPHSDAVVLIGDAAGHNDPMIGCGLSIALRDARLVRDRVLATDPRSADFEPYGRERSERMRRLRLIADISSATHAEPAVNRVARRDCVNSAIRALEPELFELVLGTFTGPATISEEHVREDVVAQIRVSGSGRAPR